MRPSLFSETESCHLWASFFFFLPFFVLSVSRRSTPDDAKTSQCLTQTLFPFPSGKAKSDNGRSTIFPFPPSPHGTATNDRHRFFFFFPLFFSSVKAKKTFFFFTDPPPIFQSIDDKWLDKWTLSPPFFPPPAAGRENSPLRNPSPSPPFPSQEALHL